MNKRMRKQYTVIDKPHATDKVGEFDKIKIGARFYRRRPRKLPVAKDWEGK